MTAIWNSRALFWLLLALPSLPMVAGLASGSATPRALLHPSGEFSARFMILAMMITPLRMLFPRQRWTMWLMRRRRYLGVATFFYAALHTLLYVADKQTFAAILADAPAVGIWTGWLAFFIFVPLAATSNDASQRMLLGWWKPLQRWVYPAAVLTLLHWVFVQDDLVPALVNFLPLAALQVYRVIKSTGFGLSSA